MGIFSCSEAHLVSFSALRFLSLERTWGWGQTALAGTWGFSQKILAEMQGLDLVIHPCRQKPSVRIPKPSTQKITISKSSRQHTALPKKDRIENATRSA